jgi:hypothetical protein
MADGRWQMADGNDFEHGQKWKKPETKRLRALSIHVLTSGSALAKGNKRGHHL